MGLLGLRKFIEGLACTSQLPSVESAGTQDAKPVDHVLFDLNSVIHSSFNRSANNAPDEVVSTVLNIVDSLLTTTVSPTKSLSICIDGPAPIAKVRTQRLRRRKVSTVNMAHNKQFSELSITAGSSFLLRLERDLASFLQSKYPRAPIAIFLHGSTAPGEGESKISQLLAHISSSKSLYDPNDSVVIVGNDIDLVLTAVGATHFHNISLLSHSSMQLISVGDLLYRWLAPGEGFLSDAHQLASARVDLVYLFSLNGGDHFTGVGEAAAHMWRRYKLLRATFPEKSIISGNLLSVDVQFLGDVVQIGDYEGTASDDVGLLLLKAALWSTCTVVTGFCPDYRFSIPDTMLPTMSHLKAALVSKKPIQIQYRSSALAQPLTPLAAYSTLMPTIEMFPDGLLRALQLPSSTSTTVFTLCGESGDFKMAKCTTTLENIRKQLANVNNTALIVAGVESLVQMASEHNLLTVGEQARNAFSNPVQLNVADNSNSKRLSTLRKESSATSHLPPHIRAKKAAELQAEEEKGPSFKVKSFSVPKTIEYTNRILKKSLSFRAPLTSGSAKHISVCQQVPEHIAVSQQNAKESERRRLQLEADRKQRDKETRMRLEDNEGDDRRKDRKRSRS